VTFYLKLVKTKLQYASTVWNSITLMTPRAGTYPKEFLYVGQNLIFRVNYEVSLECFKLRDRRHHLDTFFLITFVQVANVARFSGHYWHPSSSLYFQEILHVAPYFKNRPSARYVSAPNIVCKKYRHRLKTHYFLKQNVLYNIKSTDRYFHHMGPLL
jgi:hypothetical protein